MSRTGDRPYRRNRARTLRNSDVCALCGAALFPDAPWPDPWSTETDHILPISRGGANAGELRAVHRICHQRRERIESGKDRHARDW